MALKGIDISHHQDGIDLNAVSFDFAIFKATEGTSFVDNCCDKFYQTAKNKGACLGVYHYADGGDVEAEAQHFINNIQGYIGSAILVLDWESQGNARWDNNDKEWIDAFCNYVKNKTGVEPIVYIQKSAMHKASGHKLWVAQYPDYTQTGYQETPWNEGAYDCVLRQYTSVGRLNGFSGNLDLDKFYGNLNDWNALCGGSGNTTQSSTSPTGSTLELAYRVMCGEFGDGNDRVQNLGNRYQEVQSFINHVYSADINALVEAVKAGTYGNGEVRKALLGTRYDEVQSIINGTSKKSINEIAEEVMAGKWGDGNDRRNALTKAGYDYDEVQRVVNAKMSASIDYTIVAKKVINGDYGDMPERKTRLEAEGYNYSKVQAKVNELLN